ncbi:MarR family winged helix-turn-helix transcriptional regulator [Emticicia sp. W12TSBA100-4]|uniref:MarR family winged helix-turn-helix transcriptional regulator n=1 Tax=Emticicia sp. W12TSBA100-4 TaxID=3160965 RepID=UPI003305EB07
MNYSILQKIIGDLESFEAEQSSKNISMEDFVGFLNQKYLGRILAPKPVEAPTENEENNIGQLVAFMYRYAKSYIKKALEESTILTLDDFGYLAAVWQYGNLTKTQVIEKNIHEKNTGMEIIKRLINNQLLEQRDDETDKRSKRLKITPLGQAELFKSFDGMLKVSKIISGKLSDTERLQLFYLLNKLHNFHNPIFLNEKETSVDKLLEKYF